MDRRWRVAFGILIAACGSTPEGAATQNGRPVDGGVDGGAGGNTGSAGATFDPADGGTNAAGSSPGGGVAIARLHIGLTFSCAELTDHSLCCWGSNMEGELGNGTTAATSNAVKVAALDNTVDAAFVAAAGEDVCARALDGTLSCWGADGAATAGLPIASNSGVTTPTAVMALEGARQVTFGDDVGLAITSSGSVLAWGDNAWGEFGDGSFASDVTNDPTPVAATAVGGDVVEIGVGFSSACARKTDGSVDCWGENVSGEVGNGQIGGGDGAFGGIGFAHPVKVALSGAATSLAMAASSACALLADGSVSCWGQLPGENTSTESGTPNVVAGLETGVMQIGNGGDLLCARKSDATVWCLGDSNSGFPAALTHVTALDGAADLQVGWGAACATMGDGTIACELEDTGLQKIPASFVCDGTMPPPLSNPK